MTPEPWVFVLLALAAFRLWKFVADDDVLDRPRDWLLDRLGPATSSRRAYWSLFLLCPWCSGAWIAFATYSMWIAVGPGAFDVADLLLGAAVVLALSATVGLIASVLDALSD